MPIYEFYCPHCHRLFSFLSRAVDTTKTPACPSCGRAELSRRVSSFAISKGRKEQAPETADLPPGFDEQRLEQAMDRLARVADSIDEDDARQGAQFMRQVFEAAGLPVGAGMDEALRRMEAGEDPEKVEAEMGDVFDQDAFAGAGGPEAAEPRSRAARWRRLLPPSVDPELHEM
jgi:putative FmdB family regulatory protein